MDEPDYRQKVEEIAEVANELCTDWELEFIDDMESWRGEFTDKQKDAIDRIYKKACDSGL